MILYQLQWPMLRIHDSFTSVLYIESNLNSCLSSIYCVSDIHTIKICNVVLYQRSYLWKTHLIPLNINFLFICYLNRNWKGELWGSWNTVIWYPRRGWIFEPGCFKVWVSVWIWTNWREIHCLSREQPVVCKHTNLYLWVPNAFFLTEHMLQLPLHIIVCVINCEVSTM